MLLRRIAIVATTAILALSVAAPIDAASPGKKTKLSGTIRIDGSSTVAPLTEVAAELFMRRNPGVQITVGVSGTSGGFQKFCAGETDANDASRPIKPEEITKCTAAGIKYEEIQVANDALSVVVYPKNPLECIKVEQVKQIWSPGSTVKTWGEITGLSLPSSAMSQRITLYGPGSNSGTFDYFTEAINGKSGQIRNDYVDIGEDDQAAVTAIEGDQWAMAYIPYSFVTEAGKKVKPLQIDGGSGCVAPTLKNVQNGTYTPLGRPLFIYPSDKALARPEMYAFLRFYVENQAKITKKADFVPMTEQQVNSALAKIDSLAGKVKAKKGTAKKP